MLPKTARAGGAVGPPGPYPRVSRFMAAGMSASVMSRTLMRGNAYL